MCLFSLHVSLRTPVSLYCLSVFLRFSSTTSDTTERTLAPRFSPSFPSLSFALPLSLFLFLPLLFLFPFSLPPLLLSLSFLPYPHLSHAPKPRMVFSGIIQEMGRVVSLEERDDLVMWDGSARPEGEFLGGREGDERMNEGDGSEWALG